MRTIVTEEYEFREKRQRTISDVVACDMCGRETPYESLHYGRGGGVNWDFGYEYDEITVSRETGFAYPEGGAGKLESFHVCPDCWHSLVEWIKGYRGSEATVKETDW
jgi:hypothetical protein